jgi:CO/xanthine dehydrogenase Mo-binding subunit
MSVKDQMIGGLLQVIGNGVVEDMRYDEHGKLLKPEFHRL